MIRPRYYAYFFFSLPFLLAILYVLLRYVTPVLFKTEPIPSVKQFSYFAWYLLFASPIAGAICLFADHLKTNINEQNMKKYVFIALAIMAAIYGLRLVLILID